MTSARPARAGGNGLFR